MAYILPSQLREMDTDTLTRRLRALRLQKAAGGIGTDPRITMNNRLYFASARTTGGK